LPPNFSPIGCVRIVQPRPCRRLLKVVRVLALDAATEMCSVALLYDGEIATRCVESGRGHSQQMLSMVRELLAEGAVALSNLDGIAASIGPGAFTGVRISVAVAQGLAFGAGLRVVPVTTLEALALQVLKAPGDHAIACLDARMGEVYWGCFAADAAHGLLALCPPAVGPPESVVPPLGEAARGIGRGFSAYPMLGALAGVKTDEDSRQALPNAREMARLGSLRLQAGAGLDPSDLEPLYLRDKVALTEAERAAK
jgi:tRNA threonylcarbamoyladenosine biosynthesis protein TsaB